MTLKSRKIYSAVHMSIIVLSLVSSPLAQAPRERLRIRQLAAQDPRRTGEEKKAAEGLEKKALALIDEMVDEAMSLRLAENRVYVLTVMSDVLWARDEERARALIREAMDQVVAHMREVKEKATQEDWERIDSRYHRQMVLDLLAKRDAKLALEFLRLTRSLRPKERWPKNLELSLASHIAESDPQTALRIAEEYLDGKLDDMVMNFWRDLHEKDPKAASPLTERIIRDLKSQDILADSDASHFVYYILNEIANARNNSDAAKAARLGSAEIQQIYRDALEIVVAAALKVTEAQLLDFRERAQARNLLMQVQLFLPDIERSLPSRAPAVRAKLAQFDKALFNFQPAPQESFPYDLENTLKNKSPDELIAMAAKLQDKFKGIYYQRAAEKLFEQGNTTRARQIVKDFLPDDGSSNSFIAEIDWWERKQAVKEREQALKEGKLEEARKSVSQLGSSEERALALIDLAAMAETNKDQKTQRELLKEAGELLGDQIETRSQVNAQLSLATDILDLDPDRGFEILGSAIDRLNTVLNALVTIAKFDQNKITPLTTASAGVSVTITEFGVNKITPLAIDNARDGEIRLDGDEIANVTPYLDQRLIAFAQKDFDRTVALLKRWQVNEARVMICLRLLNGILGAEKIK